MFCSIHCRKRSRDEDSCDFMPISKRINNLSITSSQHNIFHSHESNDSMAASSNYPSNGYFAANGTHLNNNHHYSNHLDNGHSYQGDAMSSTPQSDSSHFGLLGNSIGQQSAIMEHPAGHPSADSAESIDVISYSPELSPEENPFYYNKNKLLFDLHVERERRSHTSH